MDTYDKYIALLIPIGLAFLISFFLTPIIGFIANKLDITDKPKALRDTNDPTIERRIHTRIVPKLGGLASSIPILILLPIFVHFNLQLVGILLGLIIVMVAGFLDDKKELSSIQQFLLFLILPIIVIFTGTSIKGNLFDGWFNIDMLGPLHLTLFGTSITIYIIAAIVTALWIMGITYSVKMTDGVDGILTGISAIATLIITLVSVRYDSPISAYLGAIFLGGLLGFFPYNFYPAKIFNGCGDIINGFLIAVLAITSQVKVSVLILILLLPVMDFAVVLWGRAKRRKPKNAKELLNLLSTGDKTHLHHRLLDSGMNFRQVAYLEYFIAAIIGMIAFFVSGLNFTLAIFSSFTIILLTFFMIKRKINRVKTQNQEIIQNSDIQSTNQNNIQKDKKEEFDY